MIPAGKKDGVRFGEGSQFIALLPTTRLHGGIDQSPKESHGVMAGPMTLAACVAEWRCEEFLQNMGLAAIHFSQDGQVKT